MAGNARRLMELGMAGPLAQEVAAQCTSRVGNTRRLQELGMVGGAAHEVVLQLAGTPNAVRLVERSVPPDLAKELAAQIAP